MNSHFKFPFLCAALVCTVFAGSAFCPSAHAQTDNIDFATDVSGVNESASFSSEDFVESPLLSDSTRAHVSVAPFYARRFGSQSYGSSVTYETSKLARPLELKGTYSRNDVKTGIDRDQYAFQGKVKLYKNDKGLTYSILGEYKRTTNSANDFKLSFLYEVPMSKKLFFTGNFDRIEKYRVEGEDVGDFGLGLGLKWTPEPGLSVSPQYRQKNDVSPEYDWSLGIRKAMGDQGTSKARAVTLIVGRHSLLSLSYQQYLR